MDLPKTSVIIVFHNEAWSVLLRTIWSVINRSRPDLLKEILLIDDASSRSFLKEQLDSYVKTLPIPTKVLRLKNREGLVTARLLGAKKATGEVLTFLDAHCECTVGWLEPLLKRVKENPKVAICPVIDIISDDNFSYIKSFDFHWGAFNWELHFRWFMLGEEELKRRKKDISASFKTPAMAGGLFAIARDYFFEIGSYDSEMKIWGGDNIEMVSNKNHKFLKKKCFLFISSHRVYEFGNVVAKLRSHPAVTLVTYFVKVHLTLFPVESMKF